jgi:tetratricopeptide (TPR) repeat protein
VVKSVAPLTARPQQTNQSKPSPSSSSKTSLGIVDVVQRGPQSKAKDSRPEKSAGATTAKIVDRNNQRPSTSKQVERPKTGISIVDDFKQPSKGGSSAGKGSNLTTASNSSKNSGAKAVSASPDRPKTGISVVDDIKRPAADRNGANIRNDRSNNTSASRRDGLRVDEARNDRRGDRNTSDSSRGPGLVNAFDERSGNRRGDRGGSSRHSRHGDDHDGDWNGHHSSCGHSSCHGSSHCHFSSHFHDHHHHHGWHSSWWYPYNSFGFYYGSHGWSVGLSFSNYYWNDWCYPAHYWYADCYDPYPYWHGYYHSHWDDHRCYSYRPVYGYYRPQYRCYEPYYSTVIYSDYAYLESYDDSSGYIVGSDYLAGGSTSTYPPSTYPPQLTSANDGWEYLASGDAREARRAFDQSVTAYPSDGLPKIGYALSAALLDRDQEAAEYMRRALREDPESLREIPLSEDLRVQLRPLLDEYLRNSKQNPSDVDALLMLAVLHTIDGNDAMAYFAIDRAVDIGDRDVASGNLKRMIQQSLDREPVQPITPSPLPTPTPSPIEQPASQPADGVLY